ncbi:MAG: hypothetical protein SGJ21_06130 [Alphaproteobacteria bacterium]|nr:hypothetical protein [Alphaproteobacteria bacterium]
MSFSVVWFGVQGKSPAAFLERAGYSDTGEEDAFADADVSGATYPDGWYVVVGSDLDLFEVEELKAWSADARVVAVVNDEENLTSLATEWRDGKIVWSISHEPKDGEPVLAVEGTLPDVFEEVKRNYLDKLDGATPMEIAFEVPIEVAFRITGFRHDVMGFEPDPPVFTRLVRE